jgi:methionyl-tRNA formyltransferase
MIGQGLTPSHVIFLSEGFAPLPLELPSVPYFDNITPALATIHAAEIPVTLIGVRDVNAGVVVSAVKESPVDIIVYSGPGGAILREEILNAGKKFLHIHPGILPRYRGSTTVYYSLIEEGACGATALFLDKKIDSGPILADRVYPPPDDRETIDHGYDPFIRSDLLQSVLRAYVQTGEFKPRAQPVGEGEAYFIMHPALRHIAILSRKRV